MQSQEVAKRLSVRKVALLHGIPQRVVARAVAQGELPALKIRTETGRERSYISYDDAVAWIVSLQGKTGAKQ
jgi:hypothetical protein